ncbi:MAG: hypothetical protein WED10_02410 [Brumimicrobium sp.]
METTISKIPPWKRKKKFSQTSFDDAFSKLGTMNGFINPKEVSVKLTSPLIGK